MSNLPWAITFFIDHLEFKSFTDPTPTEPRLMAPRTCQCVAIIGDRENSCTVSPKETCPTVAPYEGLNKVAYIATFHISEATNRSKCRCFGFYGSPFDSPPVLMWLQQPTVVQRKVIVTKFAKKKTPER